MPFVSQAQRRFFHAASGRGEIPRSTVRRWERETPKGKRLPEKKMQKSAAFEAGVEAALLQAELDKEAGFGSKVLSVIPGTNARRIAQRGAKLAPNAPSITDKVVGGGTRLKARPRRAAPRLATSTFGTGS